ncbi:hypothetical protein [Thermaurantiacus sp.]
MGKAPGLDLLAAGGRVVAFDPGSPPDGGQIDVAIVAAGAISPELVAWLAGEQQRGLPVILLVDAAGAEAAGTLMGARIVAFLEPDVPAETLRRAIADARGPAPAVADATPPFEQRIEELKREAERMAAAVAQLAAERGVATERPVDAPRIRAHIRARRLRERYFDPGLFADPAWDILLDLAAARLEGRLVSVSSLCIAAAVPTTTALRWIKNMVDLGLLLRTNDRNDARRTFVTLSPAASRTLDACLKAVFNLPGL